MVFAAGYQVKSVVPTGLSIPYASSELLQAGIALHDGGHPGDCLISGSAADMWAIGSLLFYMVTGEYPVVCDVMLHGGRDTPAGLVESYRDMVGVQSLWVRSTAR